MSPLPYDASRKSLYTPGDAGNFFLTGTITNEAALCAEMSRLAYVKSPAHLKQYLQRGGFQLLLAIGYSNSGTQAFIARKEDNSQVIVAFRGTESDDLRDVISDLKLPPIPWENDLGEIIGNVHQGFAEALLARGTSEQNNVTVLDQVMACLKSISPQPDILLTGHSLGAALATLTASRIPLSRLYTFGSPRVGNAHFSSVLSTVQHFRYSNCCDIVTDVPPEALGYTHTGSLRYIDRKGQIQDAPRNMLRRIDRMKARIEYLIRYSFLPGNVLFKSFADHAPINYVSGVMGSRSA